jgi:hypothetical protein
MHEKALVERRRKMMAVFDFQVVKEEIPLDA